MLSMVSMLYCVVGCVDGVVMVAVCCLRWAC